MQHNSCHGVCLGFGARYTRAPCTVSPQRLVHYRNTWYLDAWCHTAEALRRFSLDAVESAVALVQRAKDVAIKTVESEFDESYGAFTGEVTHRARLLFDSDAARWVKNEVWHPAQRGTMLADGRYRLEVPYADPTELVMDVMRVADHVEVEGPTAFRQLFAAKISVAASATARR